MALYIDGKNVKKASEESEAAFNKKWSPGSEPKHPGIYKCQSCGFEDVINRDCDTMPPCANCKEEDVTWKLLVYPQDAK